MKRFLNIFLLALIAICCDKGNTTPDMPIPEPKPDNITLSSGIDTAPVVSADGGKINISFTTNVSWTASVEEGVDWCKVTPASGAAGNGTVTITVDKNATTNIRYANIRIIAGGAFEWVQVQQNNMTGNEGIKPGENLP
ncbi:MAG: BACON domain-containing protein [Bacteroidales bacterium]|nr:BACON domain-containing protein [Bacteroidales bacterium]